MGVWVPNCFRLEFLLWCTFVCWYSGKWTDYIDNSYQFLHENRSKYFSSNSSSILLHSKDAFSASIASQSAIAHALMSCQTCMALYLILLAGALVVPSFFMQNVCDSTDIVGGHAIDAEVQISEIFCVLLNLS